MFKRFWEIVNRLVSQTKRASLREQHGRLLQECEQLRVENAALRKSLAGSETFGEIGCDSEIAAKADPEEDVQKNDEFFGQLSFGEFSRDEPKIAHSDKDATPRNAPLATIPPLPRVDNSSSNDEKVGLFLSLFIGRENYFAKQYFSKKTNSIAYTPVCDNEWNKALCNKVRKEHAAGNRSLCAQCDHPAYAPYDAAAVRDHLKGYSVDSKKQRQDFIAGVYPLLDDSTCRFLAIDFDAHDAAGGERPSASIRKEVGLLRTVCAVNNVPVSIERSRSGKGYHLWIFFSEPVKAADARRMGAGLITAAMEQYGAVSFQTYDRFFPSQDLLPKGGFGNLIALPLQRMARDEGNCVFLDENFEPVPDQWAFLSDVLRMTQSEVFEVISRVCGSPDGLGDLVSEGDEEVRLWEKRPTPRPLTSEDILEKPDIVSANMIFVPKAALSQGAANRIRRLATIKNPIFVEQQRMRLPVKDIPRVISTVREDDAHIGIPRGLLPDLEKLMETAGAGYNIEDKRTVGMPIRASFRGALRNEQPAAAEALLAHDTGVLHAPPGFGKTVVANHLIAERKVSTLIIVHTEALLLQWKNSCEMFLDLDHELPPIEPKRGKSKKRDVVGLLGKGKHTLNGIVDIAIYKSLLDGDAAKDFVKDYGMVIVDECHHVGAFSYEQILDHVNAKWVYGVTATPIRSDKLDPLIFFHCGPVRYHTDVKTQLARHGFEHVMIPRFTSLKPILLTNQSNIPSVHNELAGMNSRNRIILNDVFAALQEGRSPLVLTQRVEHVETLANALESEAAGMLDVEIIRLYGARSAKEKRLANERLASLPQDRLFAIVATGQYIGEGFDMPALDTLLLTMPIKFHGRLEQYIGRIHRTKAGKEEARVYDYVDILVPSLERMYRERLKGYASLGYAVKSDPRAADRIGMIYSVNDYQRSLKQDLADAAKVVVLAGPKSLKAQEVELQKHLSAADAISVQACRAELHFIVIDRQIVWYGEIDFFGKNNGDETCLRLDNRELAEELLDFVREDAPRQEKLNL